MRFSLARTRPLVVVCLLALLSPLWVAAGPVRAASELRLAGPVSGLDALDPATSRDLATNSVLRQVFRGLMAYDDALRPVPELAAEITVSNDGLTYDIALRDDATFHDGSAIEAADVVFSLTRAVSPSTVDGDVGRLAGRAFLSDIRGYEEVVGGRSATLEGLSVIDAGRLRIELSAPRSTFPMLLAAVPASIVDRDQVTGDAEWSSRPNGSGPYRVERWEPDEELVLEAHGAYVGGSPKTQRVTFRLGTNALQPFNLFQGGDIDLDAISPLDVDSVVSQLDGLEADVLSTDAFSLTYLAFRTDQPPLDDVHVRRALLLAFPRQEVAAITLQGQVAAAEGIVPGGMLGRAWPADLPNQDTEAARAEIERSRYGSAEAVPTIRVDVSGTWAAASFRDVVEGGLGVDVEIVDHDPTTFYDGLAAGDYAAIELTWGADYPDPATFLGALFGADSADNHVGYRNPEVDDLLAQAGRTTAEEARAALYERAQRLILDDAVVIPIFHDVHHALVRRGVTGVVVTPMGILRLETISVDGG